MKRWCVYILRCGDGTLYTGMTDDLDRRLAAHRAGKGAKYTRGRLPLEPVYTEPCESRSGALKREYALKCFDREEKLRLIRAFAASTENVTPTENITPSENVVPSEGAAPPDEG